ncbi:MAG: V-type ATPase subunit [Elusimicrobia bacterium]|nr:V-type ATPase subunit [Elusimicrobiota bacterium]
MKRPGSDYLFLFGAVKVYETRLLGRAEFSRLAENRKEEELVEDLYNTKYKAFIKAGRLVEGLNDYLYLAYSYFKKKVKCGVFDIFFFHEDILSFINYIRETEKNGNYRSYVFGQKWWNEGELPEFFRTVQKKIAEFASTKDIKEASDMLLEKIAMELVYERSVKRVKGNRIRDYWKYMIDIKNLLRNINGQNPYYIKGGNIDGSYWKRCNVRENVPDKIKVQPYMKYVLSEKDMDRWEQKLMKFLGRLVADMRKTAFGPEAAVAYLLSVKEEIRNINTVYTGIKMGMDKETIEEGLNLAYI